MLRGRSKRLARLFAHANHANIEAGHRRAQEKARRSLLDTVRISLTQLGIDPASVKSVRRLEADLEEEAAAPPQRAAASERDDPREAFFAKIDRMAERYLAEPAINFDKASLMQVLAWCVAQESLHHPPPTDPAPDDASDFAADSLQEQQNGRGGTRPERHP